MNNPASNAPSARTAHDEIARRAYELWEHEGKPADRHDAHWTEAERQLKGFSSKGHAPAESGNPAYPNLAAREKMVDENAGQPDSVRKIPGEALKKENR